MGCQLKNIESQALGCTHSWKRNIWRVRANLPRSRVHDRHLQVCSEQARTGELVDVHNYQAHLLAAVLSLDLIHLVSQAAQDLAATDLLMCTTNTVQVKCGPCIYSSTTGAVFSNRQLCYKGESRCLMHMQVRTWQNRQCHNG
jgi:hypothetical protein